MSDFKRRPFMAGHTDVFIMSQPFITGSEHLNSDARIDPIETVLADAIAAGTTPPVIELSFQTEAGDVDWQLDLNTASDADRTLAGIAENINSLYGPDSASPFVEAFDFEGCLRLQSLGSGYVAAQSELAYVKILPSQSGLTDAAPLFGFPRDPHPEATVTAGDLAHAPGRPLTQVNRPGVAFLARGEDRVSQNFNRALHQLGINDDSLNTRLKTRVPVPTVVDIPRGSPRLKKDASNHIIAVDLSSGYGDDIDNIITPTSRVFVGGLSNSSTLLEIAQLFSVQDQDDNQIQADERVVRVGAAANGYLIGAAGPTYASEGSAPSGGLIDAVTFAPDHGNLFGVQITKTAATVINAVEDNSVIVCNSATFTTDGVKAGDVVTISGSTLNAPINHNGDYVVETVVSQTRLVVRPVDHNSVHLLNQSESANLGSATVKTDGSFAENCALFFSPPLSDFPPDRVSDDGLTTVDGILRIVLGTEAFLGEVPQQFLTKSTVMTAAEVDAFVSRRLWRRMSFDGIYQGQSYDFRENGQRGGGAEGRITHAPISFDIQSRQAKPSSSTTVAGTGTLSLRVKDLVLETASSVVLSDSDIGKVVYITPSSGSLFAAATPFVISEFLSYREVRVTPPVDYKDWRASDFSAPGIAVSFDIYDDAHASLQAAMLFVANDRNFDEDLSTKMGSVFIRNHRDLPDNEISSGTAFLHLERIRHVQADASGSTTVNARFLTVEVLSNTTVRLLSGSDVVYPHWNNNIFYANQTSPLRQSNSIGCTILRIVNGPNTGFYEITATDPTGIISLAPVEGAFDGTSAGAPALNSSTGITEVGNLFNVVFASGGTREVQEPGGTPLTAVSSVTAYADASDKGPYGIGGHVARAIQAHWNGHGTGLYISVNDPEFISNSFSNAAHGDAIDIQAYAPADGISVLAAAPDTNAGDYNRIYGLSVTAKGDGNNSEFNAPTSTGQDFTSGRSKSFGGMIAQMGHDPALVLGKAQSTAVTDSPFASSNVSASPTLVVTRSTSSVTGAVSGVGSAAEFVGSLYVRTRPADGFSYGGVYSEDSVGAGRWLYPMWGWDDKTRTELHAYETAPELIFTPYSSEGYGGPTTLGNPGQMLPRDTGAFTSLNDNPLPPDHTRFNFAHSGVVQTSPAVSGYAEPYNKYVGCIFDVIQSTAGNINGNKYAIVAVEYDAPYLYLALKGASDIPAGEGSTTYVVRGMRWHRSHIDIADWFQVGTWDNSAYLSDLPLVTVDRELLYGRYTERDVLGGEGITLQADATNGTNFRPMNSLMPWTNTNHGSSKFRLDQDTNPLTSFITYRTSHGWEGDFDQPRHVHTWAQFSYEGRPPFSSTTDMPVLTDNTKIQLEDILYTTTGAVAVSWSEDWGGVIKLGMAASSSVSLNLRGRYTTLGDHLAVMVRLRINGDVETANVDYTPVLTLSLVGEDGTVLGDSVEVSSIIALNQIILKTYKLRLDTARFRGAEGLIEGTQEKVSVRLRFQNTNLAIRNIYLQEISAETLTKPLLINSPAIVSGPVVAHGFRYTDTVKGYKTVSPLEVELYQGWDYGKNFAWPQPANNTMGTQEIRGGPGLIRTVSQGTRLINKSIDAIIEPEITANVALLENAVQMGYDPTSGTVPGTFDGSYPGSLSDEVADFNAAADAYNITPNGETFDAMISAASEVASQANARARQLSDMDEGRNEYFGTTISNLYEYEDHVLEGIAALDGSSGLAQALSDREKYAPQDRWVEPHVDYNKLFRKGPQSTTITLYNGAFDPVFYALQAHYIYNNTPSEVNESLSRDMFIPPGYTGFMSPIDVPHGALLSEVVARLSFRESTIFGIYYEYPDGWASINTTTYYRDLAQNGLSTGTGWASKEGVFVEVWRHSLFPNGDVAQYAAADFDHKLTPATAELIYQTTVEPSAFTIVGNNRADQWTEPSLGGAGDLYVDAGEEEHHQVKINLLEDANRVHTDWNHWKSMLRSDRTQYSYFMVIRFMGGPRKLATRSDLGPYADVIIPYTMLSPTSEYNTTSETGDSRFEAPYVHTQVRQPAYGDFLTTDPATTLTNLENFDYSQVARTPFYGRLHPGPHVENRDFDHFGSNREPHGPQVKFRGARFGWVTDRGGDGGWGS